MANKLYEETDIQDIAKAIREKNGSTDNYFVSQMGNAIRNLKTGGGVPITLFTNVLDLDTTQKVKGYRMTSSSMTVTENVDIVAIYVPTAETYTFRIRGVQSYGENIFRTKLFSSTDKTHGGGTTTANYYNGYVDEYGDYCLDIKTTINGGYVCFNFNNIPNGAIITIDEPIGTGNYTNA